MSGVLKYLSFHGRSNRKRYWLTGLSLFGLAMASVLITMIAAESLPLLALVGIPLVLVLVVAMFANSARRLHDRNKSAWWLLLFYVLPTLLGIPLQLAENGPADDFQLTASALAVLGLPFSIWGLVELGFLKGPAGPNRFGEDPLPAPQEPAFA
jgi:uncharacterized membrane protein YhaH (DUF805 family)